MDNISDVRIEIRDGQLVIHDPYEYVSGNKTILQVKILPPNKPERNFKITKTKKDGYMFQ